MKKIISLILTLAALCFVFPAFASIGAIASYDAGPVAVVAKASIMPMATQGNPSQTQSCQTCHAADQRSISYRPDAPSIKHNQTHQKPIVTAGAVFLHPD